MQYYYAGTIALISAAFNGVTLY